MILLNPGPVTLSPRVREALQGPDLCHRESEFAELCLEIIARLGQIYAPTPGPLLTDVPGGANAPPPGPPTYVPGGANAPPPGPPTYVPVLLSGSGTAAVEAMLATLAPRRGGTLVVANGVYGERMATMLQLQGKPFELLTGTWTQPIDTVAVEARLDAHPELTHLATVHHETTTGRLNDLEPLLEICRRRGVKLLLDAVSSFGAEPLSLEPAVAAVAATANKCLHGIPGICMVLVQEAALAGESQSPCLYLDLTRYAQEQQRGFSPFTMAVQSCYALREALREFAEQGGAEARRRRYLDLSLEVRETLLSLGIEPLLPAAQNSSMLTAYRLPEVGYTALHDRLKQSGFTIYAGQGALASSIFRIATMGHITDLDKHRLLASLREIL